MKRIDIFTFGIPLSLSFILAGIPAFALAQEIEVTGSTAPLISLGYFLSSLGFFCATGMMIVAVKQFGRSPFADALFHFIVGTAVFFAVTMFETLGPDFFKISEESMDFWWHLMFFIAMISYFKGVSALVSIASDDPASSGVPLTASLKASGGLLWGGIVTALLVGIFSFAHIAEPLSRAYLDSPLGTFGLHHFLACALAGAVGWYLFQSRKNLGLIGSSIATPFLVAIWAFSLQHLWELQFESWRTISVSPELGEGGEKIFLIIAAFGVTLAAYRLKNFSKQ